MPNLITLRNLLDIDCDTSDPRILVLVKSLGPRKTSKASQNAHRTTVTNTKIVTTKKGKFVETRRVLIFDNSAEASLNIWTSLFLDSTEIWTPLQTLLLITNPRRDLSHQYQISTDATSFIEVDPICEDAQWLRSFAHNLTKRQHVNLRVPEESKSSSICEILQQGLRLRFSLRVADLAELEYESAIPPSGDRRMASKQAKIPTP